LAAIIYYYVNRDKGKFVQFHTLQSLYSQIPVTLLNSGLVAWTIVNLVRDLDFFGFYWGYLVMVATANLVYFIFSIVGAVRARKGFFTISFFSVSLPTTSFDRKQEKEALSYQPAKDFKVEPIDLDWDLIRAELK